MEIIIINHSANPLPSYATEGSSGMDLRANLEHNEILHPLERKLISTGLFVEIPSGFEAQVRPRSGLALKYGITCLNTPGTIDSDYRGEIKVLLVNLSNEAFSISPGERIAQLVFCKIEKATLKLSDGLTDTKRSDGGFGHTGVQ